MSEPSLAALLEALADAGTELAADGELLRYRPSRPLATWVAAAVVRLKPALLELLRSVRASPIGAARLAALAPADGLPPDSSRWPQEARDCYVECLGRADDLGMDTAPGAEARAVALREARRVAAGLPADLPPPRDPDLIDAALAAFAPLGGLTFVSRVPAARRAP